MIVRGEVILVLFEIDRDASTNGPFIHSHVYTFLKIFLKIF